MVRTIVQLEEDQHRRLRELADARGTSVAALVREGVDRVLDDPEERRRRVEEVLDGWAALDARGPADLARNHDEYTFE